MRFESQFYKAQLNKKHQRYQFSLAGCFALLSFGLIAGLYKDESYKSSTRRLAGIISRAANGLNNMDSTDLIIAGLTSLGVGFLTILVNDLIFQHRKIIVAFQINHTNNSVVFETKTVGDKKVIKAEFQFQNISFSEDKLKDGINAVPYDCLKFRENLKEIGTLYLNHPMWSSIDSKEFDNIISDLKKNIR